MIVGLTGSLAAGKGVVSDFLKEKGYAYLSLSNEVREVAKERGIELNRDNLQNLGNQLRKEHGNGVLAKFAIDKIRDNQYTDVIVDGIRNPAEVEELRKLGNFVLISVDAPKDIRFKRLVERNRESDPKNWEGFMRIDNKDKGIGEEEYGQGVGKCMEMADFRLVNDKKIDEVISDVKKIFSGFEIKRDDFMSVKVKRLHPDAKIPIYAMEGDAGMDVFAVSKQSNGNYIEYGTGLAFEIPKNHVCLIFPRSSISNKKLSQANSVGVLDSGYRGELKVRFYKHGDEEYDIGDKIGQIMVIPYPKLNILEVNELSSTQRGEGGFGSSGI